MKKAIIAAAALTLPSFASAALVLQTVNAPRVITFDSVVNDTALGGNGGKVWGFNASASYGALSEGTLSDTGTTGWRSPSVSMRASGVSVGNLPANTWSNFGMIADGDTNDNENLTVAGMAMARGVGSTPMTNATTVAPLAANGTGFLFGQTNGAPYRDGGITLAVSNQTGATVGQIQFALDSWFSDPDTSLSSLRISYSTDNSQYTELRTLAAARTTTAAYDATNAAHWSSLQAIDETITLASPLANNGLVYFRVETVRPSGSGSNWLVDNLSVAAVPEPTAIALMSLAGLALIRRRK